MMKRFAYTLSEVLVTLTIIGVTAAMITPAITNIMPDKKKAIVLKKYVEIQNATQQALNDSRYYRQDEENPENKCIGLACTTRADASVIPEGEEPINWEEDNKYQFVMQNLLGGTFERYAAPNLFFRTDDGVLYQVSRTVVNAQPNNNGGSTTTASTRISITLSNDYYDGEPAAFSADNQNPRTFRFSVDTYGNVTGNDPLTRAYLMNPNKLNNKAKDLEQARKFLSNQ